MRNLLASVPGVLDTALYNERGLVVSRHFANGVVSTTSYDAMDRLATLNTQSAQSGNKTLQDILIQRDGVGNLLTLQDALRQSGPLAAGRQFSYDDLYRVVSGQSPNQTWNYAYNVGGDFTSKSDVGTYTYGAGHQVAQAGPNAYGYDAAGEVTTRPHFTETFDAKGRLATVSKDDGTHVAFGYDYAGKRTLKQSTGPHGSHTTVYVSPLAEERDGQLVDYVFAGGQRIARFGGQKPASIAVAGIPPALALLSLLAFLLSQLTRFGRRLRRQAQRLAALAVALALASFSCGSCGHAPDASLIVYHSDFLGGTSFQTDNKGTVIAEVAYSPFGQQLSASSEPYAFTGKEFDEDTGLYDFGAREYDPVLGRFVSPDPAATGSPEVGLSHSQRLSPFAYCLNNPAQYVDPNGKDPVQIRILQEAPTLDYVQRSGLSVQDAMAEQGMPVSMEAESPGPRSQEFASQFMLEGVTASGVAAMLVGSINFGALLGEVAQLGNIGLSRLRGEPTPEPGSSPIPIRPARLQPQGGNGVVLRDGQGATPAEMAASTGGQNIGRGGQAVARARELAQEAAAQSGPGPVTFKCWRCGETSVNPADMHLGHRNVPASAGGNNDPVNTCLEGAACNLGAGDRGDLYLVDLVRNEAAVVLPSDDEMLRR